MVYGSMKDLPHTQSMWVLTTLNPLSIWSVIFRFMIDLQYMNNHIYTAQFLRYKKENQTEEEKK